jgi:putative ATPase
VLERLTDEEIIRIIKGAIARVTSTEQEEKHVDAILLSSPAALPIDICSPSPPPPSSPMESPQENAEDESSATTSMPLQPLFPQYPHVTDKIISSMASLGAGDARTALSLLEQILLVPADTPESALLDSMKRSVATSYDRTGDARYDLISALQKSIRGSQGGAALYWLARMLEADGDPMYVARRLVVCASEDIGMADPHALPLVSTTPPEG